MLDPHAELNRASAAFKKAEFKVGEKIEIQKRKQKELEQANTVAEDAAMEALIAKEDLEEAKRKCEREAGIAARQVSRETGPYKLKDLIQGKAKLIFDETGVDIEDEAASAKLRALPQIIEATIREHLEYIDLLFENAEIEAETAAKKQKAEGGASVTTATAENSRTEAEDAGNEEPKASDLEKANDEKTKEIQRMIKEAEDRRAKARAAAAAQEASAAAQLTQRG